MKLFQTIKAHCFSIWLTACLLIMLTFGCNNTPVHDCYVDDGLNKLKTSVDVIKHAKMYLKESEVKDVDISLNAYAPNYDKFVEWYTRVYFPVHCKVVAAK